MSRQIPYILELPKVFVQWNENSPLDNGAEELLPEAIITNCASSQATYWQRKWQLSF